jgi:hypothetical protein
MPLLGEERSQSHRVDVVSLVSVRVRLVLRPIVSCAAFKTTFEILHGRIGSAADCSLERHWTASDVQEWRSIRTQWLRTSRTPINIVVSDDKRHNVDMLDFPYTVLTNWFRKTLNSQEATPKFASPSIATSISRAMASLPLPATFTIISKIG